MLKKPCKYIELGGSSFTFSTLFKKAYDQIILSVGLFYCKKLRTYKGEMATKLLSTVEIYFHKSLKSLCWLTSFN